MRDPGRDRIETPAGRNHAQNSTASQEHVFGGLASVADISPDETDGSERRLISIIRHNAAAVLLNRALFAYGDRQDS